MPGASATRRRGYPRPAGWAGLSCVLLGVKGEVEGRTFADGALGPYVTSVAFYDLPHAGQADAGAGKLAGRVQPLERSEQLVHVLGVETGAVVPHVTADGGVPGRPGAELDRRCVPARGELPGVAQQVLQDRADEPTVGLRQRWTPDDEIDVAVRLVALEFLGDQCGLRAEIHRSEVQFGPCDAGEVQQVIDECRHL